MIKITGMFKYLTIIVIILGCSACATNTRLYEWGAYEDQVYKMYVTPEATSPDIQLEKLNQLIAESENIPPGVFAHIAFLHNQMGDAQQAIEYLLMEKQAFPESATLVDGMLARMNEGISK